MPFLTKNYKWIMAVFCGVFAMQLWLCSGTLSPYAATLYNPHLINDQGDYIYIEGDTDLTKLGCYYIANYDHMHYVANFRLLQGKPKEDWNWAYLLRRPLLYMLSYPFMHMFGFLSGGFIIAVIINIAVLIWFCNWVKNRWNEMAAIIAVILLSAYPATMYWSGPPYPHSLITACTLVLTILLYKVYETTNLKKIAIYSFFAGITFLAYDTYIFFIPAFGLLLLFQRKWLAIPVSMVLIVIPLALWLWFLNGKTIPSSTGNTDIYSSIIGAYGRMTGEVFWQNLKKLPYFFYLNFTGAVYMYLAAFMVVILIFGKITRSLQLEKPFWVIAIAMFTVFVFNNMAPYYEGWQMRGDWIARIYQPAIVLCLLPVFPVVKSFSENNKRYFFSGVFALVFIVFAYNTRINISPALGNDELTDAHYRFYLHSLPETMHSNLEKHGRRPLWVCP